VPAGAVVVRTISEYAGSAIPAVQVQVNDLSWTATDANGCATFPGVAPPFTLRAYQSMAGTSRPPPTFAITPTRWDDVWELRDVTENPAVLQVDGTPGPPPEWNEAAISGLVTGTGGGPASGARVVALAPVDGGSGTTAETNGTFAMPYVQWEGPSTQTFTVHALESDDPPTHYSGYGSARVTASNGGSASGVLIALSPVAETHLTGTASVAPEFSTESPCASLAIEFPDASVLWLPTGPCSSSDLDVPVPLIGARTAIVGLGVSVPAPVPLPGDDLLYRFGPSASAFRRVDLSGAPPGSLAFDLPSPVSITEPADGATISADATIRWTTGPEAVRYVLGGKCAQWEGSTLRRLNYRGVDTTGTEARLPALPSVPLLPGTRCVLDVGWRDAAPSPVLGPVTERRWTWRGAYSGDVLVTIQ